MTFSIAARCDETGMLGAAVCSSSIAVAARCAHVAAHTGAVLTQNVTDPALGPLALRYLDEGLTPEDVVRRMSVQGTWLAWRQIVVVGLEGMPAVFTGERALGLAAHAIRPACAAAGNLLDNPSVPIAMVEAFEHARGHHLAARLVWALQAGLKAGGEVGPVHAAGVKVAQDLSWPIVDLRVDWSNEPLADLWTLWGLYDPQLEAYVMRARAPDMAPAYGVPGERSGP